VFVPSVTLTGQPSARAAAVPWFAVTVPSTVRLLPPSWMLTAAAPAALLTVTSPMSTPGCVWSAEVAGEARLR